MELFTVVFLIMITAICKAIADTLADHYSISIFSTWNRQYYDKSVSWTNKYKDNDPTKGYKKITLILFKHKIFSFPIFTPLTDAWHLVNSLQIATFIYLPFVIINLSPQIIYYLIFGIIHILTFNLFYNYILRKKKK